MNKYEIFSEKRRGPFRLFRQKTFLGTIESGQVERFHKGSQGAMIVLALGEEGLWIGAKSGSVRVESAAQPQMRKPTKVVTLLDESKPYIRTSRSRITIKEVGDTYQHLVIVGPEPEPLRLTKEKAGWFAARAIAEDKDRQIIELESGISIQELERQLGAEALRGKTVIRTRGLGDNPRNSYLNSPN